MKKSFIIAACVMLVACNEEPTRDVSYYLSHQAERDAKLAECANNPGEKSGQANCRNAKEAHHKSMMNPANTEMPKI